jgi:hypothetical protein
MTNRVVLGNRGGAYGLVVSKPFVDVFSAAASELLLSTDIKMLQVMHFGSFTSNGGDTAVSWPAFGFRPRIIISSQLDASATYTSDNSATVNAPTGTQQQLNETWVVGGAPTLSTAVYWAVLNMPG